MRNFTSAILCMLVVALIPEKQGKKKKLKFSHFFCIFILGAIVYSVFKDYQHKLEREKYDLAYTSLDARGMCEILGAKYLDFKLAYAPKGDEAITVKCLDKETGIIFTFQTSGILKENIK